MTIYDFTSHIKHCGQAFPDLDHSQMCILQPENGSKITGK
jgi:hypothetical protein